MSNQTNYRNVVIPEDKDPEDYHYTERRADILRDMENHGHPEAKTQREWADKYGVSQTQIHKDTKRLKEFYQEGVGDQSKFLSEMVHRKAIKKHVDDGEFGKALSALNSWNNWLFNIGAQDKEPDKQHIDMDADHSVREMPDETKQLLAEWNGQQSDEDSD